MKLTEQQIKKLEEKLESWSLSKELFGNVIDMNDFESDNYKYFLDNVKSRQDLVRGLNELSPFADDSLLVAQKMSERDFRKFKNTINYGSQNEYGESEVPKKYYSLAIPQRFFEAVILEEKFRVSLGVILIRMAELEKKEAIA